MAANASRPTDALADTLAPNDPGTADTMAAVSGGASTGSSPLGSGARYDLRDELGRGGMGRVRVALDRSLEREVALKELLTGAREGVSVGAVARFVREARVTGRLEHPGIVPVHELGRHPDGTLYYTMMRIRGRSLASALADARTLAERLSLLPHFRHVCDAVAYAHSRGVVHRDLKPANVMIGAFGETLVVDWGLAKVSDEAEIDGDPTEVAVRDAAATIDGAAIGTPAYMSPEQARGDLAAIDERSDVWGLGAMLFELLTGRPPFAGATALAVVAAVLRGDRANVLELEPRAPRELVAIVDRALHRDRAERYASAAELTTDIAAFQDGRSVGAYQYSAWEQIRRFATRHRAASVAALVVALMAAVAGVAIARYAVAADAARARAEAARTEALRSDLDARIALSEALLERAERALSDREPASAALWAAASMMRDPLEPSVLDETRRILLDDTMRAAFRDRRVRALSAYAAAEDVRRLELSERLDVGAPEAVASSDARTIARTIDGDVEIIDLETHVRRRFAVAGAERVLAIADAHHVVVYGTATGVYDDSGTLVLALPEVTAAFAGGGHVAVSHRTRDVDVLSADLASIARHLEDGPISTASWTLGGTALVTLDPSGAHVHAWPDLTTTTSFAAAAQDAIASSSDGTHFAVGLRESGLLFGSAAGAQLLPTRGWTPSVTVFAEDGLFAVAEAESFISLRRSSDGALVEMTVVPEAGMSVALGPQRLVRIPTRGIDEDATTPTLVFTRHAPRRQDATCDAGVQDVALDSARHRLIAAVGHRLVSLDVSGGGLGPPHPLALETDEAIWNITVGDDGSIAAVSTRAALAWWTADGEPIRSESGRARAPVPFYGVAVGPGGREAFVASAADGDIRRIARDGTERLLVGHTGTVRDLALSPDGTLLASASDDRTVRLWTLADGEVVHVLTGFGGLAAGVAFTGDGSALATADGEGVVRIFATSTWSERCAVRAHTDWINRIGVTADGAHVLTGSDDGSVRVTDAHTCRVERIVPLQNPGLRVLPLDGDIVFPDGRHMVRIPALPAELGRAPTQLLEDAERRSGMRIEGLDLVPRDGTP